MDERASHVFALPPGAPFVHALVAGLRERMHGTAPEAMADVSVFLNTRRAARAFNTHFANTTRGATFLPRVGVIDDMADLLNRPPAPPLDPLRRQLTLARLIETFLAREDRFAPQSSRFDLARALAALLDELHGWSVEPSALETLDVADSAGHWQTTLRFLRIVTAEWAPLRDSMELGADPEAWRHAVVNALVQHWATKPPPGPVIIAGSTGSRPPTAQLMRAVATLEKGCVVLPGFDTLFRPGDGETLRDEHPQTRIIRFLESLDLDVASVPLWHGGCPRPARQKLISLSLCPAPVTDTWLRAAPDLEHDIAEATANMTLIEATSPREEALAIALLLRETTEHAGKLGALVTPDRILARRVGAAMARWGLTIDDTAGRPLHLTPPALLIRLVLRVLSGRASPVDVIALLKHPLCGGAQDDRRQHMLHVSALEAWLRRRPLPEVSEKALVDWAQSRKDPAALAWADWLGSTLAAIPETSSGPLPELATRLEALTLDLSRGVSGGDLQTAWSHDDGQAVFAMVERLRTQGKDAGILRVEEFAKLVQSLLAAENVPDAAVRADPRIAIMGTLEARMETADRTVLGALNEGTWPGQITPDPWLSRPMREALGLPSPERLTGLAAHDYQNAICGPEVVLSRSTRMDGAPTVASRWLIRLVSLIEGLGDNGASALRDMRKRGDAWLEHARRLDRPVGPVAPEPRPAPTPPLAARPRKLSVTQVERLIRDPYSIYAQEILRLRPIDPLGRPPDARDRGTLVHTVLERFLRETGTGPLPENAHELLDGIAVRVILHETPWPTHRRIWRARLARAAQWFLDWEAQRRAEGTWSGLEIRGARAMPWAGETFTLTGKADRIDSLADGTQAIYDYKTGKVPSKVDVTRYARQVWLEAAIAAHGGFKDIPPAIIGVMAYVGVSGAGNGGSELRLPASASAVEEDWSRFAAFMTQYADPAQPYPAHRIAPDQRFVGDYDHLARLGEWVEGGEDE